MAELSITALTNVDLAFNFDFEYRWTPEPIKLASITPLMDQALAGFNIMGFPLTLGVSYGIDIKCVLVPFSRAAACSRSRSHFVIPASASTSMRKQVCA
jgi:hypothetical protein